MINHCMHGTGELSVWNDGDADNSEEIHIATAISYVTTYGDIEELSELKGVLTACLAAVDYAIEVGRRRKE